MKDTKRLALIALGVAIALISIKASAQDTSMKIVGMWYAEDLDQSMVEVVELEDGSYEGVIKSSSTASYIGHKVLYDFLYQEGEKVYRGTIHSASRDMELDGYITMEKDGRLKLTGKKFFMTRTFYWERKE